MPKQLEKKTTTELEHISIELSRSGSPGGAEEEWSYFISPEPKLEPGDTQQVRLSTGLLVEFGLFSTLCDNFCLWNREMLTRQHF